MPKNHFTIKVEKHYDDGIYWMALCPEFNFSIACDSENEAITDMKDLVKETLEDMSDSTLAKYDMDRNAFFNITVCIENQTQLA